MVTDIFTNDASPRRRHPDGARLSYWQAPDGWRLRRMDWPQPEGRPVRGSLLFAGGRGDFIEKYLEALHHWHDAGWNVTTFDWRGQGLSQSGEAGKGPFSFDPMVVDLDALLRDLSSTGSGPHVAIGHSMGGHLLLRTLVDKAPPVDAAVLVAPMIRVNSKPFAEALAPWMAETMCLFGWRDAPVWKVQPGSLGPGSARQRILTRSLERYEDELWWWEREPGLQLGGVSWGWLRAAYRSEAAFTAEKLAGVDVPMLLIGTDRDRLVSPEAIRAAAARLPKAELHIYPDAAHEILREVDRVRLDALARIDAFLAEHAR